MSRSDVVKLFLRNARSATLFFLGLAAIVAVICLITELLSYVIGGWAIVFGVIAGLSSLVAALVTAFEVGE